MPHPSSAPARCQRPPDPKVTTRELARTRAREIAHRTGRGPAAVSQADYEQAKRELTGTSDALRQEEILTPAKISKRAAPDSGSGQART